MPRVHVWLPDVQHGRVRGTLRRLPCPAVHPEEQQISQEHQTHLAALWEPRWWFTLKVQILQLDFKLSFLKSSPGMWYGDICREQNHLHASILRQIKSTLCYVMSELDLVWPWTVCLGVLQRPTNASWAASQKRQARLCSWTRWCMMGRAAATQTPSVCAPEGNVWYVYGPSPLSSQTQTQTHTQLTHQCKQISSRHFEDIKQLFFKMLNSSLLTLQCIHLMSSYNTYTVCILYLL